MPVKHPEWMWNEAVSRYRNRIDAATGIVYSRYGEPITARDRDGYAFVYIYVGPKGSTRRINFLAHRLMWMIVNGAIPDGLEINHKNSVRDDNRIDNLELVTKSGNAIHGEKYGFRWRCRGSQRKKKENLVALSKHV